MFKSIRTKAIGLKLPIAVIGIGFFNVTNLQAFKTSIGHNDLVDALTNQGIPIPDGTNVPVTMVEANLTAGLTNYLPDVNNAEFSGKTIIDQTGVGTSSFHATVVGRQLFGNTTSMTPGITQIDAYGANAWLNLGWYGGTPPTENNPLQNHSWVNWFQNDNLTRRTDYAVVRDGFLPIVGLYNSDHGNQETISNIPDAMGSLYNGISVGVSDGTHRYGTTTQDGSGRVKPEIVAPSDFTSYATPIVTSAAALLIDAAGSNNNAKDQLTLKAILLAGADKSISSSWDQTPTRPIDEQFGAGELDIYESYFIQQAGQQSAGNTLTNRGWNLNTLGNNLSDIYNLSVPEGYAMRNLSVLVTWNRVVTRQRQGPTFNYVPSLANLSLSLEDSNNNSIYSSDSPVDNIEHIWRDSTNALSSGNYTIEVSSDASAEYAIAWRSELYQDYSIWSTIAFDSSTPSNLRDPEDDPDGDGIENLLEQALGGDPNIANTTILPVQNIVEANGNNYLELSFTRPSHQNDLSYIVQTTMVLDSWPTDSVGVETTPVRVVNGDGTETLTYRRTQPISAEGKAFMRLQVINP